MDYTNKPRSDTTRDTTRDVAGQNMKANQVMNAIRYTGVDPRPTGTLLIRRHPSVARKGSA